MTTHSNPFDETLNELRQSFPDLPDDSPLKPMLQGLENLVKNRERNFEIMRSCQFDLDALLLKVYARGVHDGADDTIIFGVRKMSTEEAFKHMTRDE